MSDVSESRILAVVRDTNAFDTIVDVATHSFAIPVTRVAGAAEALDIDKIEQHDVVLADFAPGDMSGIELATRLLARGRRSVLLLAERPSLGDALSAMRVGVCDVLVTPLEHRPVFEALGRALRREELARREVHRSGRVRALLRRVLHDRRGLNRRIELLCRDMVGAQRRLFHRVLSNENNSGIGV